ncbi:expressed unknown protein [Ectocarpus siliculosus]|uniref:Uncharacterized protein n=1 Tax=Ectocarpus siliculosus TaxID=2880 RepID=D7G7B9_ECTSI|nr:expressed unknown protein [Ectocarpus siliculosus]|eukprot:CBJ27670.1 expressed unknown protein [Ectocarpus siliculosus]
MRADIFWSAVWSSCFIGGVILGSTGPANTLAFGSSSPSLRGSSSAQTKPSETTVQRKDETVAAEKEMINETVAAEKEIKAPISSKQQEEEEPGATGGDEDAAASITPTTKNRSLGDLDSSLDESLLDDEQPSLSAYGLPRSKIAQRIKRLNGGLWGPTEEEEKEIAKELAALREEDPSSSQEEEDIELLYYSYDYDFEDGGLSYSYEMHNF